MSIFTLALRIGAFILVGHVHAFAETISLAPEADTTLSQGNAAMTFGSSPDLLIGSGAAPQSAQRALIRFDIASAIPAGSTITGARLVLSVSELSLSALHELRVLPVRRFWYEDTATWTHHLAPTSEWSQPGGSIGLDLGVTTRARIRVTQPGPITVPLGRVAIYDIQRWLDDVATNQGWLLLSHAHPGLVRVASRENASDAPRLEVDYTPVPDGVSEEARYRVVFRATWSPRSHPYDYPRGSAHWSGLVGGLHDHRVNFWVPGQPASLGIQRMAERGSQSILAGEVSVAAGEGTAGESLIGDDLPSGSGVTQALRFTATRAHPRVTLTTMVAPSPDWFVGVRGASLLCKGRWVTSKIVQAFPFDSGTDSGPTFESPNEVTIPRGVISEITAKPLAPRGRARAMGYFYFRREP